MSSFKVPEVPERHSSLLPAPHQNELAAIKKRKASAASILSNASSADEFIEFKTDDVTLSLEYAAKYKGFLLESYSSGRFSKGVFNEAIDEVAKYEEPKENEIRVLKRQRKLIKDDLSDEIPRYHTIEDAYHNSIVHKVMNASGQQKPSKSKSRQSEFKDQVVAFYGAGKWVCTEPGNPPDELWCHLLGWQDAAFVKAAHIVPKSLESDEVAYTFGTQDLELTDPKNGLTLNRVIEVGLDSGLMVIVPTQKIPQTEWKCVVTDKNCLKRLIYGKIWWKDIDGKELTFLTQHRPARRFLYFRFVITYLEHKRKGTLNWVADVETKGMMWASPGPYLRQTTLVSLARKISDCVLPEAFVSQTTFQDTPDLPSKSKEEEEKGSNIVATKIILREPEVEEEDDGLSGIQVGAEQLQFQLQDSLFVVPTLSSVSPGLAEYNIIDPTHEFTFNVTAALRTSSPPPTLKGTIALPVPQPGNMSPKIDYSTIVQLTLIGQAGPFALYSAAHVQNMTSLQLFSSSIDILDERSGATAMFFKLFSILEYF